MLYSAGSSGSLTIAVSIKYVASFHSPSTMCWIAAACRTNGLLGEICAAIAHSGAAADQFQSNTILTLQMTACATADPGSSLSAASPAALACLNPDSAGR